ncbi:uncharacterized protein YEL023C [Aspergillus udagawae]|uniref:Uncharacterized protein YEL023C n=1 Tax=Aspergillus udagawae TaxID=91492 RepID=A0A8H3P3K2_9EURO|nr:uncharacterized protein YEL023C [Aspergillus udagawae]GFF50838.1 uncharacterized protein YEL023C [Aspergillus udagawae]GFF83198.1 uncharacterized protein YEL023C [Aspergillus udagawae]GFG18545.1 uncharacterized protein YEL023C [Aspergillus udagawae]GFG23540.1 uncharacterized protein YEL023C [Aspergillus udagawae]
MDAVPLGPAPIPKQFVLCFDGTGNKFCGDESDSNVLKIYRMLDRSKSHQFHYYQPGIGTYVTSNSLSSNGRFHRIKSAYLKAKDSAVGSSFDQHVMGGYKFLMRYYAPGDEIYFIGFSRGAYIARFLAEMLDYIGLLEAGNEELTRFAWKTFAKWQQRRRGDSEEEKEEKRKLFRFMKAFRETFSRPISRIKFMGLFDTVNSVPRFESAWMQRSKFPYTARSSARVIRHAVGIDERRAKFRQDLISEDRPWSMKKRGPHRWQRHLHPFRHDEYPESEKPNDLPSIVVNDDAKVETGPQGAAEGRKDQEETESVYRSAGVSRAGSIRSAHHYRSPSPLKSKKTGLAVPILNPSTEDLASVKSGNSMRSLQVPEAGSQAPSEYDEDDEDESLQDIKEVWFPGGHADIGGGWKLGEGEEWPLSHAPLVWMVHEAKRAGLQFDPRKLKQFECSEEYDGEVSPLHEHIHWKQNMDMCQDPSHGDDNDEHRRFARKEDEQNMSKSKRRFLEALYESSTKGHLHDCLAYGNGLPFTSVLSWRIMEYLPFRRMDLQSDGSWKPIRWPLPCGEVRDIPNDAQIHVSAIRRLKADPKYRPGNLIVGGGGRGVKRAPEEYGIGEWVVKDHEGDAVREVYVRKSVSKMCREAHA